MADIDEKKYVPALFTAVFDIKIWEIFARLTAQPPGETVVS
jgi:hypothetical protein